MDDREEFRASGLVSAAEMAKDDEVRRLDRELTAASDRHGYSYMWEWLGLPIIQMPTDVMLAQEIIWRNKPDLIIETGVARGGSALFYSSMMRLLGRGSVVAVDIEIRPHNRVAIESHEFSDRVTLVEGSSTDAAVVEQIGAFAGDSQKVMVVLDSDHTHEHVLAELEAYTQFVSPGQFMIVADTVVEEIPVQVHRPRRWGTGNNPRTAVDEFLRDHPGVYDIDAGSNNKLLMSSSYGGYLQKL